MSYLEFEQQDAIAGTGLHLELLACGPPEKGKQSLQVVAGATNPKPYLDRLDLLPLAEDSLGSSLGGSCKVVQWHADPSFLGN